MGDYKKYYKIGSRWDGIGLPQNCIAHIFDRYQAIFLGEDKVNDNSNFKTDLNIDDLFVIADGITLVGVAIIKSDFMKLKEMNIHDKLKMDHGDFIHKDNLDWAQGYKAKVVLFNENDKMEYSRNRVFHGINNADTIKHIDKMMKKYNIII